MKPPILIIFGITGDLSKRKLLPALYHLMSQQLLPEGTKIIGVSRKPLDIGELLGSVELCVLENDNVCDPVGIKRLKDALMSIKLDPDSDSDFESLSQQLDSLDAEVSGGQHERLFYMSIPSDAYAPIVSKLGKHKLNGANSRLLLEKPFGHDLQSATELIDLVGQSFTEPQVYRIDHYLAKETAQNILTFRTHNSLFNSVWSSSHIERVVVESYEKISIEGRSEFYEKTGALRDLIQSHLLHLLAITLMDLPATTSSKDIHRSKRYFLEQLIPADPQKSQRAQYKGYRDEVENQTSATETYASVSLEHSAERWKGMEILLCTGKSLARKRTSITIDYKSEQEHSSNNLTFHIQPDESITLDLIVKKPGLDNDIHHTALKFDYKRTFNETTHIDAYERVLLDAVRGDQSLFSSNEEVLATWRVMQPIVEAWQKDDKDLLFYEQGSEPDSITRR